MKVKTRSKSQIKRQQILAAATELFTEQGYAATSMDLIANNGEVSKQTVYSHFGSKDELFAAAIEQKCDSYHMLDFEVDDLTDPKQSLLILAQRFLTMLTSKEACAVHKICAYEAISHPTLSELFYQAGPEKITTEVAELMTLLNERNILNIANPHFAALQFLNMMKGEAWMRVEFNTKHQVSQNEIDAYLLSSVELFMRGYGYKT
ncbi:MAG: TetR family transcriptional regulator [Gammaproteobacteria bacterium]|nr:MAG: TetR family transcriptional regulator [Gammaproteobacteria bacterium]